MARRPWMPCCKPCILCPVCIPGTYNSTHAAVVSFHGEAKDVYGDPHECCNRELIGPEFELPKTGFVDIGEGHTCCTYELVLEDDDRICATADSYFSAIRFMWCDYDGLNAKAIVELDFFCDLLENHDPPHEGKWTLDCDFTWRQEDQTKGRYCNEPVWVTTVGMSSNCDNYSICYLDIFDKVNALIHFLPPGPGRDPDKDENYQCSPPERPTGLALWGGPTSAIYSRY